MTISSPRWDLVKSKANEYSKEFTAPPVPILEIAERNGVDVIFANFGSKSDKVAGFCDFGEAKLYVNQEDSLTRQVFTIAHEFGHWVLHKEIFQNDPDRYPVLPRFHDPDRNDPLEKEANSFAANILVPEALLKPITSAPISALANAFGVSVSMMEYRTKNVRR